MSRFDSPQNNTETSNSLSSISNSNSNSTSQSDGLLQWGHRKRARVSRGAIEDSSSCVHVKQHRRIINSVSGGKLYSASMLLPPPPPFVSSSAASNGRAIKDSPRNLEDPSSAAGSESPSRNSQVVVAEPAVTKFSPSAMEKSCRKVPCSGSAKCQKPSGSSTTQASERVVNNSHGNSASVQSQQEAGVHTAPATSLAAANGDKVKNVKVIPWPRIYIALSRKEKEDDFLAMKGTKIPQRPKKRAKNIDRTLQYCFPGLWLSDLTKSRYEVREKKSMKKQKRRGLKGMENMDSDSE
ncbi:hypothetical protein RIF29_33278 [Crotalaria pallida]|uniref:Uncharacterized protein n=1 Tax=Crotalaria pallida TaxID=3830 RepID=A0AAN9HTZ3_CROPI